MTNRSLIVLNMLVSYGRSLVSAGLTLFSTRWILEALGKEDLGLYYAVGGIIVFLSFISTSMLGSANRNFAYALGHGGPDEVQGWFNSALSLHLAFAAIFLVLSLPLGIIAFSYWFKIPDARVSACVWVYVATAFTTAFSIFSVPYNAIYIARQHIYELTIIQTLHSVAAFVLSWWLLTYSGDRLKFYAAGVALVQLFVSAIQIIRCRWAFPESALDIRQMVNRERYRGLCYFSGLGLLTTFAYFLRSQGIAILLNRHGTSGVNAAYGIANNVQGQIGFLSRGFMNAIAPEITKLEGRGEHEAMVMMANRSCKFTVLMILFLFIPLFTDIHPLLVLWLKNVPECTDSFVRIMFLAFLMVQSVLGVDVAIGAHGKKLVGISVCATITLLLAIPIAYGAIWLGLKTYCIVGSIAMTVFLTSVNTLYFAHRIMRFPVKSWAIDVLGRNGALVVVCFIANLALHRVLPESMLRLIIVGLVDGGLIILLGWILVLTVEERKFVEGKIIDRLRRIRR